MTAYAENSISFHRNVVHHSETLPALKVSCPRRVRLRPLLLLLPIDLSDAGLTEDKVSFDRALPTALLTWYTYMPYHRSGFNFI